MRLIPPFCYSEFTPDKENAMYTSNAWDNNNFSSSSCSACRESLSDRTSITEKAMNLFRAACGRAFVHRLWAFITRQPRRLLDLAQVTCCSMVLGSHSLGTHPVELRQIRGSMGRTQDFDDQFNPLKERVQDRWKRVALAFLRGDSLPAVELVEVDGTYFVRDGHHRISVARAMGREFIDAEVVQMYLQKRIG